MAWRDITKWIATQIAAGAVRKIGGLVVGGLLLIVGWNPQSLILSPPNWLDHPLLKICLIIVGLLIIAGVLLWQGRGKGTIPIAFELQGQRSFSAKYNFMPETIVLSSPSMPPPAALVFDYGSVVITNVSSERAVSLDLAFHLKGKNGQRGDFKLLADGVLPFRLIYGRTDFIGIGLRKRGDPPLEIFTNPVAIAPEKSVNARLVFLFCPFDETMRGDLVSKISNAYFDTEILITDHVSGVAIAVPETVKYRGD